MILLIDNYDSFSYNLVQLIGSLSKEEIKVIRNDELSVNEIDSLKPSHIILSPGPGRPEDAGVCIDVIKQLKDKYPILGVCLGHQSICESFGADIIYAKKLMHGKQSKVSIDNSQDIFKNLPEKILVARYHSLAADARTMPPELEVISKDECGEIMAVKHKKYCIYGLQFHPESVLTPDGRTIIENFLKIEI
ncbi:MAG: anthranilate synthase component II [Eubacterium sp.]